MELFLQLVVTGVMLGSIFALVSLGWVLIYKCSGVLNLAMGELDHDRRLRLPGLLYKVRDHNADQLRICVGPILHYHHRIRFWAY